MASDFYPTPLSAFAPLLPYLPRRGVIWEPAAGDRRLIESMRECGLDADGDDLANGYDFLVDQQPRFAVVTNPPFSLCYEFCQHALEVSSEVYLLIRLNFLASNRRKAWFMEHEPNGLFILSSRPKFINNSSDACDYAWCYWGKRWNRIRHL